ncbi:fbxl14-like, partial [Tropilaelaps mercedesae]
KPPQQTQDAFGVQLLQVGSGGADPIKMDPWPLTTQLPAPAIFHPLHLSAPALDVRSRLQSAAVQPSQTHVSALYPEILAMIFSYLDVLDKGRAAQVCTAWRDAAYHKSVWKGVEAKLHLRRANPSLFPSLVRRGIKRVQVLSLRRSLRDVVQGVPNLESLNMSGCYNLTDNWVNQAFPSDVTALATLTSLNLSMCKQITDSSLGKIAQQLHNLETLELGGCSNITNMGLLLVAWGLKKLKNLNLRSCRNISDDGLGHLAGSSKEQTNGVTSLEVLSLQDCQKLTDDSLAHIAAGLTNLRSINLSFCASVTDSGMKQLAKMPHLRELNLRTCDNISDMGMAYLAEGGSQVSTLDVSFCDKIGDQGLVHVSHGLGHLRSLSLNACPISDDGLRRLSKALVHLQTLNIGQCVRITDVGLAAIAEGLQHLECIDLYGCPKISTVGLQKVMQLKGLRVLNLGLWQKRGHEEGVERSTPAPIAPLALVAKRRRTLADSIKSSRPIVHHQSTATTNYLLS